MFTIVLVTTANTKGADIVDLLSERGADIHLQPTTCKPMGIVIKTPRNGFQAQIDVFDSHATHFPKGQCLDADPFRLRGDSPHALDGLEKLTSLEWVIYVGAMENREDEIQRCARVVNVSLGDSDVKALLLRDTFIPINLLAKIVESKKIDLLVVKNCILIGESTSQIHYVELRRTK